jgi:hypothetical protein
MAHAKKNQNQDVVSDRQAAIQRGKNARRAAQNPNRLPAPPAPPGAIKGAAAGITEALPLSRLLNRAKKALGK